MHWSILNKNKGKQRHSCDAARFCQAIWDGTSVRRKKSEYVEAKGAVFNGIATPQLFQRPSFWVQSALVLATLAYIDAERSVSG
jgi:hypothetical protein